MSEREAFEAWAFENGLQSHTDQSLDYPLGNVLWKCWQGRAAIEAQRVPDGFISDVIRSVAELEYTSIEGSPAVMQVTADELAGILSVHLGGLSSAPPVAQPAERKPLSEEQIREAVTAAGMMFTHPDLNIARAIERAHGIGD